MQVLIFKEFGLKLPVNGGFGVPYRWQRPALDKPHDDDDDDGGGTTGEAVSSRGITLHRNMCL